MELRSEQAPVQPPPLLDRELLARDLDRIGQAIAELVELRLPLPIRLALRTRGHSLGAMIGEDLQALLDLTDPELVTLIDALATELGAWRRARAPVQPDAALRASYRRLLEVAGAA